MSYIIKWDENVQRVNLNLNARIEFYIFASAAGGLAMSTDNNKLTEKSIWELPIALPFSHHILMLM